MYIYAFSNHLEVVLHELSNKKALLKKKVNRSDNFTNLSLLGVEQCLEGIELDKDSNLYISSSNGNMNSTMKILDAIFQQNRLPMPFNFLNSVNASILFFVAKNFGIEGKAIFTDTFESALIQAYVDVQNGKTVLLGDVSEALSDINEHKKKFQTEVITEHSKWLLLSNKKIDKIVAKIDNIKVTHIQEDKTQNLMELFNFLETKALKTKNNEQEFQARNLSFTLKKVL